METSDHTEIEKRTNWREQSSSALLQRSAGSLGDSAPDTIFLSQDTLDESLAAQSIAFESTSVVTVATAGSRHGKDALLLGHLLRCPFLLASTVYVSLPCIPILEFLSLLTPGDFGLVAFAQAYSFSLRHDLRFLVFPRGYFSGL